MAFATGTSTDYRDLLDDLRDFAVNDHVATAVVNAGGTGYVVGDVLTVSGGTGTSATVEVTSVSTGVVDGVFIRQSGSYTANPGGTGAATTGGTGTGCTLDLTFTGSGWTVLRDTTGAYVRTVPNIVAGGTGYAVDDILTLDTSGVTGVTSSTAATLRVTAVSSGVITAVSIETEGSYSLFTDTAPTAVPVTGGTGTGATFNIVLEVVSTSDGTDNEREVMLRGDGNGTDEIYVGIRSYYDVGLDLRNWELMGATGFEGGLEWENQPGKSNGDYTSALGSQIVPLANASLDYWFNVDSFRLRMVAKIAGGYMSMYLGFLDRFATAVEYPYPLVVAGSTWDPDFRFNNSTVELTSVADPVRGASADEQSNMQVRSADGTWYVVANRAATAALRIRVVQPTGELDVQSNAGTARAWINTANQMRLFIPNTGDPGNPNQVMQPTPNTGGDIWPKFPCQIAFTEPSPQYLGQIDDIFWVPATSGLIAEDRLGVNQEFTLFESGNRSESFSHFAMRTSGPS